MHENAELIRAFYAAFQQRDHEGMAACYHTDVQFSDPVFTDLHGDEARAMWHMLCDQGEDLEVSFSGITADSDRGTARWEAHYTFGPSGHKVHNVIGASFVFADGKIIQHTDMFDLWKWTRMALGVTGTLIGWTPSVQRKVSETGRRGLDRFLSDHPEYSSDSG
jgi:ketosteroid isomerase-like protein